MENLKQSFTRFLLFWADLKTWQKMSVYATTFGVLGLLFFLTFSTGRTGFEALYTNLEAADEMAVVSYLRENNIPHQIDSPTKTVFVPRNRAYEVRLALAEQGFPKRGVRGLEIFDNSNIMGDTDKRIAFLRAREGELQRTIIMMDAVESAKVNLVIPQPQLFLAQREPATASVLVTLKRGAQLRPSQVKAIVHLVSRSVEGLRPEDVTLVDTEGRVLSDMILDDMFVSDGQGNMSSVQREMERNRERYLEGQIRAGLTPIYGPGNVMAAVTVALDFNKETVSSTQYTPLPGTNTGIIRSRNTMEENFTGEGSTANAPPGTTTNIPGYVMNTGSGNSEYSKSEGTTNFEISTQENNRVLAPGSIRRLTASIVVNRTLDEEGLTHLRDIATGIIGYDASRNDVLVVKALQFDRTLADRLAMELQRDRMLRVSVGAFIAILMLAIAALTALWWLRRRRARAALEILDMEAKKRVPTIQEMLTSPDLLAFQGEMTVLEEQLRAYARNNPGEVANLVNEWISASDS